MYSQEVLKLFEPIQNEEVQFLLLSSTNYHHNMQQVQLFSLFVFSSPSTRNMFTTLYHNLPLTQYPECPPLLVIAVDHVSWSAQQPDQMPISLTSLCNCQCQEDGKLKFQLSNCSICNRRIKVISSRFLMGRSLATTNFDGEDIAVGKSFNYLPDIKVHSDWSRRVNSSVPTTRCIVCAIFHDVQIRDSSTTGSSTTEHVQTCSICNVRENNWICLMCGYIGCGRYTAQHAHQHFDTTRHRFSLELVSGRLWDYIQDTFVNFENNSSVYGGMMQSAHTCGAGHSSDWTHPNVNPPHTKLLMGQSSEMPPNQLDHDLQSKLNQSINEYERLVEWQLQDQQLFYEKMIARETVRAMEYSFRDDHLSDKDKKGDEAKDFNEGMEEIEAMKYEITVLESEYRELHDQLRFLDDENQKYKKMNDDVAHEHKCLVSFTLVIVGNHDHLSFPCECRKKKSCIGLQKKGIWLYKLRNM